MAEASNTERPPDDERLYEVSEWLRSIFGSEDVPPYELNEETIEILHQLMVQNKERCRETNVVIDDLNQKIAEYSAEDQKLARILGLVGVSRLSFPEMHRSVIDSMCSASCLLNLKNPSTTSFLVGLSDLSKDLASVKFERITEKKMLLKLRHNNDYLNNKRSTVQEELHKAVEEANGQKEAVMQSERLASSLSSKQQEYTTRIKHLSALLRKLGVDESIHHDTIVKKNEELKSLEEELGNKEAQLKSYNKLPLNMELAQVTVAEAQVTLDDLNKQLDQPPDSPN